MVLTRIRNLCLEPKEVTNLFFIFHVKIVTSTVVRLFVYYIGISTKESEWIVQLIRVEGRGSMH